MYLTLDTLRRFDRRLLCAPIRASRSAVGRRPLTGDIATGLVADASGYVALLAVRAEQGFRVPRKEREPSSRPLDDVEALAGGGGAVPAVLLDGLDDLVGEADGGEAVGSRDDGRDAVDDGGAERLGLLA